MELVATLVMENESTVTDNLFSNIEGRQRLQHIFENGIHSDFAEIWFQVSDLIFIKTLVTIQARIFIIFRIVSCEGQ